MFLQQQFSMYKFYYYVLIWYICMDEGRANLTVVQQELIIRRTNNIHVYNIHKSSDSYKLPTLRIAHCRLHLLVW